MRYTNRHFTYLLISGFRVENSVKLGVFSVFLEISVNPRSIMNYAGFPASSSGSTSMSSPGPVPDRLEPELDRPEAVLLSQTGSLLAWY